MARWLTYGNRGPEEEEGEVGLHKAGSQGEAAPHQHTYSGQVHTYYSDNKIIKNTTTSDRVADPYSYDTDPDPAFRIQSGSRGFDDQKLKKIYSWKN